MSRIPSLLKTRRRLGAISLLCGIVLGALLPAALVPGRAVAQMLDTADIVQGGVRPGWREPDGHHMAALHLTLAENWKTYWRAPGVAGIPPRFDWSGSENIASVTLHWPRPVVFEQSGIRSVGYEHELILPMEFTLIDPTKPARLEAMVDLGVCETICVPVTLRMGADLRPDGADDRAIRAALADQPRPAAKLGLSAAECAVEPISDGLRVTVALDMPSLGGDEFVVFELPDATIWVSESMTDRQGKRLVATSDMVPTSGAPFGLDRSDLRITVLGATQAVELTGCPAP
jgi:DsbC/DsbD-like thiol-disulfide interchange protein